MKHRLSTGALPTNSRRFPAAVLPTSWWRFALPAATDLVFMGMLFSLCCGPMAPRLLEDAGIGWHIRNGQQMLQTHAITRMDSFSSTMSGHPWFAWEWLYDLGIAFVHQSMGLNGVVFFTALVIAAAFAIAFRLTILRGGNFPISVILLALSVGAASIHLLARPHVLTWLLAVVWFQVLDSWETSPGTATSRRLLWLPLLMLLWVNLHGGFLLGFVLLGIYLITACLSWIVGPRRASSAHRIKYLGIVTFLALLATFANPYGYRLHVHIYEYLGNHFLMNQIEEFRSPDFHKLAPECFALLLVIALITLALSRERPRVSQLLVIIFSAWSGLYSWRNLPVSSLLLMLVAGPILSGAFAGAKMDPVAASRARAVVLRWERFSFRMKNIELALKGHLWPLTGVVFLLWICLHGGKLGPAEAMTAHFPASRFPVQAVDFMARNKVGGPVFSPDEWGGYLIYKLYPQMKVVVDDRHDLYGEEFLKQYLKLIRVEPGWQLILKELRPNAILIRSQSPLAGALSESREWKLIYRDKVGALFQRLTSD
jgi:hypothetical protein